MTEIETGDVARYCKPSSLDNNGSPMSTAFQRRPERNEGYLSVHLLDYFKNAEQMEQISQVKRFMEENRFNVKQNALFAVLNIEKSKEYVMQEIEVNISYKESSLPHAALCHESDDVLISELLAECVQKTYPVKKIK